MGYSPEGRKESDMTEHTPGFDSFSDPSASILTWELVEVDTARSF